MKYLPIAAGAAALTLPMIYALQDDSKTLLPGLNAGIARRLTLGGLVLSSLAFLATRLKIVGALALGTGTAYGLMAMAGIGMTPASTVKVGQIVRVPLDALVLPGVTTWTIPSMGGPATAEVGVTRVSPGLVTGRLIKISLNAHPAQALTAIDGNLPPNEVQFSSGRILS
jgi:hypothetical protein